MAFKAVEMAKDAAGVYVKDVKGVTLSTAQYEALISKGRMGADTLSIGARIEQAINQRFSDDIVNKLVGNAFGNVTTAQPPSRVEGFVINLAKTALDSDAAKAAGERLMDRITDADTAYKLGKIPLVKAIAGKYGIEIPLTPEEEMLQQQMQQQMLQQQPKDINRQLTNYYNNPAGGVAPANLFPSANTNMQRSNDEIIASLNPADDNDVNTYINLKGLFNVQVKDVKQKMQADIMKLRGTKPVGLDNEPLAQSGGWEEKDLNQPLPKQNEKIEMPRPQNNEVSELKQILFSLMTKIDNNFQQADIAFQEMNERLSDLENKNDSSNDGVASISSSIAPDLQSPPVSVDTFPLLPEEPPISKLVVKRQELKEEEKKETHEEM